MVDAACRGRDPRVFFPGRSGAARLLLVEARAICSTCPVREPCADHAIASGEKFGVWGGLSEKQRRVERRRRRQEPAPP
jgi:WhiB family redox-sensing transcriptional regulator